jgi:hypothetical protein
VNDRASMTKGLIRMLVLMPAAKASALTLHVNLADGAGDEADRLVGVYHVGNVLAQPVLGVVEVQHDQTAGFLSSTSAARIQSCRHDSAIPKSQQSA